MMPTGAPTSDKLHYSNTSYVFYGGTPVAEFSASICSTTKFIYSLDDGVPRLLIAENVASYKSNVYKNGMMSDLNITSV